MTSTNLKAGLRLSYTNELLLKLRDTVLRVKPSLPDLDIVLKVPQIPPVKPSDNQNNYGSRPNTDYNSKYQKGFNNDNKRYERNCNSNDLFKRNALENIDRKLSTIFEKPVELHKSESAWKCNKQDSKDEIKDLLKNMQSLLNKLAPENFDKIISQMKDLKMDTLDKLDGCVRLLFEKAVSEQHFSPVYAKMTQSVSHLFVEGTSGKMTFKHLLLQKCQKEFQRDRHDDSMITDLAEKIKIAKIDEDKKILTEEKEMAVSKSKRRSLGNVKFLGELFKLNLLNENIMIKCLHKLLDENEDEESLECLCKLLTTCGKSLAEKSKAKVDILMKEFEKLMSKKTLSPRIKFLMMDVNDLKNAKWIPKKNEGPKTISQIHKEAETEKIERAAAAQKIPQRHVLRPSNDSFNSKYDKSNDYKPKSFEKRYENNRQVSDSREQRYANNRNGFDSRGQRYENNRSGSDYRGQRYENNRSGSDYRGQRYENNRQTSDSDNWRSGCRSNDKPRESSYQNKKYPSNYERRNHIDESNRNRSIVKVDRSEPIIEEKKKDEAISKVEDIMSRDEMELKVKSRIEEYLSLKDIKEAIENVKDLKTDICFKNAVRFFYISLSQNIEKSSIVREQIGVLHNEILDKKVAPVKAYTDAWIKFSKFADDLIIDIPQIWTYISELLTPVVIESSIFRMNMFAQTDSPDDELDDEYIVDVDSKAKLLAAILNGVSKVKGELQARKTWTASRLKLQDFVKDVSVEEFKDKFNLVDIIN